MRQNDRQEEILRYLSENDYLSVDTAIELFSASPATVRRDFTELAANGKAERVRGALRKIASESGNMPPFALREVRHSKEKTAMAKFAVTLLRPGDVLIVDGGTSTFHLAHFLPEFSLKIITNSIRLAMFLDEKYSDRNNLEVFLTGGFLYPKSYLLTGLQTKISLNQYHAGWTFLSAGGINTVGVSNNNELAVESEQVMIENSDKVVVIADHSKIGRQAMCQICRLDKIDYLITDNFPENETILKDIEAHGVQVVRV